MNEKNWLGSEAIEFGEGTLEKKTANLESEPDPAVGYWLHSDQSVPMQNVAPLEGAWHDMARQGTLCFGVVNESTYPQCKGPSSEGHSVRSVVIKLH